ncbi:hypothetical protein BN59_03129 [Legionella massiliensis]|uniref:Uncharacterized protein n=1 Tax=Legionella massiliensis TaxID=1034943 RepID=A0A078KWH3_9GAMM|nr:hypothetical protein BN59_03129 [Legionella massiliensis]CEE14553.1 hypothetical protein BN1094_03129 [Legionella massiliensis]
MLKVNEGPLSTLWRIYVSIAALFKNELLI